MYESFYGLSEKPFNLTPDPDFLYLSNSHKRALTYLKYGIESKEGFIQLSGEIGSGKTTLLRSLLRGLNREIKAAYIVNPRGTFRQILRAILDQLSVVPFRLDYSKERLLNKFHEFLKSQEALNHPVVIIFDEAQNLDVSTLEELRMLSNYETDKKKLVQIILVGQPELREKLDRPELVQLRQRIAVRCHLGPLTPEETEAYINHRLKIAGSNGAIRFEPEACRVIQQFSRGIPRLINVACNNVMLAGYVEEKRTFTRSMVERVIGEMESDDGRAEQPEPSAAPEPEPAPEPARTAAPAGGRRSRWLRRLAWAGVLVAAVGVAVAVTVMVMSTVRN
jgi:putative secretion ATPase (PEP-CTERM system associated)